MPYLANLVLFMYELEFFTDSISRIRPWHDDLPNHRLRGQHGLMRRLCFCTRYIDDLWNPLVPAEVFQTVTDRMYPPWLKLGMEHKGRKVNYLDMTIWHENGKWHSKLYDKKVKMIQAGLKLNKFPHPASKLSTRCKYGVITSQLHRYNVACTEIRFFMEPALDLYDTYVKKGYDKQVIDQYCDRFIRNHMDGKLHTGEITRRYNLRPGAVHQ